MTRRLSKSEEREEEKKESKKEHVFRGFTYESSFTFTHFCWMREEKESPLFSLCLPTLFHPFHSHFEKGNLRLASNSSRGDRKSLNIQSDGGKLREWSVKSGGKLERVGGKLRNTFMNGG